MNLTQLTMTDMFSTRWRRMCLAWAAMMALLIPAAGRGQGTQEVIVNEICAANDTVAPLAPLFLDYMPDYVELYNNSGRDIDLFAEGWSMTDDVGGTNGKVKYLFPPGITFYTDTYLLVFCDDESPTNFPGLDPVYNLHTGFNLDAKGGETIYIYRNLGSNLVTSSSFGIQVSGYSVGRVPGANLASTFTLNFPTPCGGLVPCDVNQPYTNFGSQFSLKINEWLATNSMGFDWVEIFNPDTNIIDLGGLVFTDDNSSRLLTIRAVPNLSYISPTGFVRFWCSGLASKDADHLDFSLSSGSDDPLGPPGTAYDKVTLWDRNRITIINTVNSTLWRARDISEGRLPDGAAQIIAFPNPSPEDSNVGPIPEINLNEILTHTDPPLEDAVELHNVTGTNVDVSFWWLSNSKFDGKKYQIPPGTVIPPGGFYVLYERDFNNSNLLAKPFTLNSAHGDEVYLFKGDAAGNLTGFRKGITFGAAINGISFGRYVTSDGNVEMVPMSDLSFGTSVRAGMNTNLLGVFRTGTGATNPLPLVGPVVINEIYYHPTNVSGVSDIFDAEFVELRNITADQVPLYYVPKDAGEVFLRFHTNGWRIEGVIGYDFPGGDTTAGIVLNPDEYILLVNFDPSTNAQFTLDWRNHWTAYSLPPVPGNVRLFGPYRGKLSNRSGTVTVRRPDTPQTQPHPDAGFVPYVLVERAQYSDSAPWPTNTSTGLLIDGGGASLQRRFSYEFCNDPTNWFGDLPTPGGYNSQSGLEKPYFTESPQDFSGSPTTPVEFRAPARGTGPIAYQWYHDGAAIPGATASTLNRTAGNSTVGQYFAVASNPAGSSTSRVARLSISCPFFLSRPDASFGPDGGSSNVVLTGSSGCMWATLGIPNWVTVTSATGGDGGDVFTYTVAPYSGTTLRSATLTIAGVPYTIMQSPPDTRPPTVGFTVPGSGARVFSHNLLVRGTAADNVGISRVEVQVGNNGVSEAAVNSTRRLWTNSVVLAPGTNWIHIRSYDIVGNPSAVVTRPVIYVITTPITLGVTGTGSISGAANQQRLELGRSYVLTARPGTGFVFSNWTSGASGSVILGTSTRLTVNMQTDLAVTANFVPNPFIPTKGVYNGLFYSNMAVHHTNSGAFKLTLTPTGKYSVSIRVGGKTYAASGTFDLEGRATNVINRPGLTQLTIVWQLGWDSNTVNTVSGNVSTVDWVADLSGDRTWYHARTNPAPLAGSYTLIIPGSPGSTVLPQGDGHGTVKVNASGLVTFAGKLGDGTRVSQSVTLSRNNEWPLYALLYSTRGSVLSWVVFDTNDLSSDLSGLLSWVRPPIPTSLIYPSGFEVDSFVTGSRYRAPVGATNKVLQLTDAVVKLEGGNLISPVQPIVDPVTLGLKSVVTNIAPNALATLAVRFTVASGLFSGTFTEVNSTRRVTFYGAVHQKQNYGSGYFLGTTEAGRVAFEGAVMIQAEAAVEFINMAVQKQQVENRGIPFPPLPPVPGLDPN